MSDRYFKLSTASASSCGQCIVPSKPSSSWLPFLQAAAPLHFTWKQAQVSPTPCLSFASPSGHCQKSTESPKWSSEGPVPLLYHSVVPAAGPLPSCSAKHDLQSLPCWAPEHWLFPGPGAVTHSLTLRLPGCPPPSTHYIPLTLTPQPCKLLITPAQCVPAPCIPQF